MSGASQGLWRVTHSVGQAEVGDRQWVIPGDSCKDRRALPGGHSGGRDTSAVAGSGDRDWQQGFICVRRAEGSEIKTGVGRCEHRPAARLTGCNLFAPVCLSSK